MLFQLGYYASISVIGCYHYGNHLLPLFLLLFTLINLKGFPNKVEQYILNPDMWQVAFVIQRCLFPMIKVLCLGDTTLDCGGMSKLVYYVHKTDKAIKKSMELLKDFKYFRTTKASDANDVEGIDLEDGADSDNNAVMDPVEGDDKSDTNPYTDTPKYLGEQILEFWNKQRGSQ
jgi:hypothetical protein